MFLKKCFLSPRCDKMIPKKKKKKIDPPLNQLAHFPSSIREATKGRRVCALLVGETGWAHVHRMSKPTPIPEGADVVVTNRFLVPAGRPVGRLLGVGLPACNWPNLMNTWCSYARRLAKANGGLDLPGKLPPLICRLYLARSKR